MRRRAAAAHEAAELGAPAAARTRQQHLLQHPDKLATAAAARARQHAQPSALAAAIRCLQALLRMRAAAPIMHCPLGYCVCVWGMCLCQTGFCFGDGHCACVCFLGGASVSACCFPSVVRLSGLAFSLQRP
jgi:hypothetical protein